MRRTSAFVVSGLLTISFAATGAQVRPAASGSANPSTQRMQDTRTMHVACIAGDSARGYRRAIGAADTLRALPRTPGDTMRITGGTERSHEYPDYDVVLDIPNVCVERIFLKVDSLTAKLNLHAQIANLVTVNAGADVLIGNVDLTIQDVRAKALLLVDLDDVVHIVDQTLTFVDNHPEIVQQLGSTLQNTAGALGGAVGGLVRALVIGTTKLANGNVLQRIVDQATGSILERTMNAAGQVVAQKAIGSVLDLPTIRETTNTAGQLVRQVRDQAGSLLEYTLEKATNKLVGVRLLSGR